MKLDAKVPWTPTVFGIVGKKSKIRKLWKNDMYPGTQSFYWTFSIFSPQFLAMNKF